MGCQNQVLELSLLVALVPLHKGPEATASLRSLFCKPLLPRKSKMPKAETGVRAEGDDEGLCRALGGPWGSHY